MIGIVDACALARPGKEIAFLPRARQGKFMNDRNYQTRYIFGAAQQKAKSYIKVHRRQEYSASTTDEMQILYFVCLVEYDQYHYVKAVL